VSQPALVIDDERDFALLTVPEVARILRCSEWSVRARIHSGELRVVNVGRLQRVPRVAVAEFLAGGGSAAVAS
jgi:excisionase family DNA binding protein